jgi:hypothetical protein
MVFLNMTGYISKDFVIGLSKLKNLNLANNNLKFDLPNIPEWGNMVNLRMIEL